MPRLTSLLPRVPGFRARARRRGALLLALAALPGCAPREEAPRRQVPGGDVGAGREALAKRGCGACHRIPGVRDAQSLLAPPLDAFSERAFVAGILPNTSENLVAWIVSPRAVDPRTAMPDLGVSEEEARNMAAYLYSLRKDRR